MKVTKQLVIKNVLGLHARAAASLVKVANRFRAEIVIRKEKMSVNGKSIMGVLMLAAAKGTTITVEAEGDDAREAMAEIEQLIENKFGEE